MATTDDDAGFVAVDIGPGERQLPRVLSAHEFAALRPRHSRTLRAALAMRGGVSLAVWIGGAAAEMDLWRRIRICVDSAGKTHAVFVPPSPSELTVDAGWVERAELYARVLDSRGFDTIEFDVMAGASAGGLNAVVYAAAQRAGADVDVLLPVWRDVASAWRLLRPPGFGRVDSLLRGDGYFWPELKRVLGSLYPDIAAADTDTAAQTDTDRDARPSRVHPFHRAARVTVDLSATLVDSEDASERGTQEGKGHFHFVGSDDGTASEHGRAIPSGAQPASEADLARLAYAARTTSSFPGAFEPALIFSKSTRVPLTRPPVADAESVDMTFAFHAHRSDWSHPFRVVDGSVLDNVPIDRAFRAIRGMASTVNATRALLYLDPSPPMQPLASVRPTQYGQADPDSMFARPQRVLDRIADRRSQFLAAISAGTGKRGTSESGPEEEDEVERFRLALKQSDGRSQSLAVLSTAAVEDFDRETAHRAYVRFRSTTDLQRLSLVTAHPSLWQLGTNLATRSIWRARSAEERIGLDHLFDSAYDDMSRGEMSSEFVRAIVRGPQALLDATLSLLHWVRALESVAELTDQGPPEPVAGVRLRIYGVLARATDARDECLRAVLDDAERLGAGVVPPGQLADVVLMAWIRESAAAAPRIDDHWRTVDGCLDALRSASPAAPDAAGASEGTDAERDAWAQHPWSGVPTQREDFGALDLAPFLAAMGIPEPISALTFWRITGDEGASNPGEYLTLLDRKMRSATRTALSLTLTDIDDEVLGRLFGTGLTSIDKLAGVAGFNFGGFLASQWRANDWWWGRLDAAAGMTRFVSSYPALGAAVRVLPLPRLIEAVQVSVLRDAARSPDAPFPSHRDAPQQDTPAEAPPEGPQETPQETQPPPAHEIRAAFTRGGASLLDLSPPYLLSIVSRSIRVASRAFSGSTTTTLRLVLAALRPLLVLAPLLAAPVRAAIAATVVGAAITATAASALADVNRPDAWTIVPGLAILGAILGALGYGLLIAGRRWRRLLDRLGVSDAEWSDRALRSAHALRQDATAQSLLGAVVALATSGIAVWPLVRDGLSVSYWVLAISAAIIAALARIWAQAPSRAGVLAFGAGTVAYAVWVALVLWLPGFVADISGGSLPGGSSTTDGIPFGLSASDALVALTVTVAGVALALLLTVGWLPIRRTLPRTWLLNAGTISLLAGLSAGAVVTISMLLRGTEFAGLNIATTVVLVIVVWGSLVWWLPEIPEGRSTAWTSAVIRDDLRD